MHQKRFFSDDTLQSVLSQAIKELKKNYEPDSEANVADQHLVNLLEILKNTSDDFDKNCHYFITELGGAFRSALNNTKENTALIFVHLYQLYHEYYLTSNKNPSHAVNDSLAFIESLCEKSNDIQFKYAIQRTKTSIPFDVLADSTSKCN